MSCNFDYKLASLWYHHPHVLSQTASYDQYKFELCIICNESLSYTQILLLVYIEEMGNKWPLQGEYPQSITFIITLYYYQSLNEVLCLLGHSQSHLISYNGFLGGKISFQLKPDSRKGLYPQMSETPLTYFEESP